MPAIDFSKALTGDVSVMSFYSKRLLAGGETPFQKHDFISAIQARGDELFPNRPSPQQRFARALDCDPTAQLYYKAMQRAPGTEVVTPVEKVDSGPVHIGPAHAKMYSLAIDRQRERTIRFPAAYAEVYTNPANAALREQVKREHLEAALAGIHGGPRAGTLNIQEAQRLGEEAGGGKVKDFPASAFGASQAKKSAETEIQKLADRYRSEHPNMTAAQAYTHVLTSPQHREIAKRALAVA